MLTFVPMAFSTAANAQTSPAMTTYVGAETLAAFFKEHLDAEFALSPMYPPPS